MGHEVPPPSGWLGGDDCAHCEAGKTPKYGKVTFEGMSVCGGCWWTGFHGIKFSGSGNGTYILTQNPSAPCRWEYTKTEELRRDAYSDPNCDIYIETIYETLNIVVLRFADSVTIEAYASGYWPAKKIFFAENIPVIKCVETNHANNTCTCANHEDRSEGGTGKVTEGF